jgi:hypothetical protein
VEKIPSEETPRVLKEVILKKATWTAHWLIAFIISLAAANAADARPADRARLSSLGTHRPLAFEENRGQTDPRVKYLARGDGYTLYLTPLEAVLAFQQKADGPGSVLRMRWANSPRSAQVSAEGPLPGVTNYLTGKDPSRWRTGVPSWTRVHYEEVWPGIDLAFYGNPRQLEHDVVVAPGADPERVRLAFEGAEELRIDATGDLVARVGAEEVRLLRPVSYQEVGGARQKVESGWRLLPGTGGVREAGFRVAAYDRSQPLVIDPVLVYSTYLGGSLDDGAYGGTADAQGNLYVTGSTNSPEFPLAAAVQTSLGGDYDAFVTKLAPSGSLVYSTYLGGSNGEQGEDMDADDLGNVVLTGFTNSPDFPRIGGLPASLAGGDGDAFVTKLGPGGEILFSTLLGGSRSEAGYGVGIDAQGRVYVGGRTSSTDFPARNGLSNTLQGDEDAFVARLSSSGAVLEAATYLGGSASDYVLGMAVDPAGNVYLPGFTSSRDFPLVHPVVGTWPSGSPSWGTIGFVAKLEPSLTALVYSTWFSNGWDITADPAGNTYVIGLPVQYLGTDVCMSKLGPAGDLLFSSCFGGSSDEGAANIEVDPWGNIVLAGGTYSADFPLKDPVQNRCGSSMSIEGFEQWIPDIFVTKLDATGQEILFSTCLGGTRPMQRAFYPPDEGVYGLGVDARGDIYLAGWTYSADFPTVNAVQPEHGGGSLDGEIDAIAARISFGNAPPDCSRAAASPSFLWPPNGKFVPVSIVRVTDPDDDPLAITIKGILQDEPRTGKGPDATGIRMSTASVRAFRTGNGDGRVYHLTFTAMDPSGASCTGTVTVCVPRDQGRSTCGDGGALVDSTGDR